MEKNTSLIYTGDNFNIVFNNAEIVDKAFETIKSIVVGSHASNFIEDFEIDRENNKIFLSYGSIGDHDTIVKDICFKIAQSYPDSEFYGHAFYDDEGDEYESCAEYEYNNRKLILEIIESPEGPGCCPECGEQLVCFDEFDPNESYYCDDCEMEVSAEDMFEDELPKKTTIEVSF